MKSEQPDRGRPDPGSPNVYREPYEVEHYTPSDPKVEVKNPINLRRLVPKVKKRLRYPPRRYRGGKRRIAKVLQRTMRIGESRAAFLVDRMEDEGLIVYERPRPGRRKAWRFRT